jgi:uncharacterized protein
VRRSWQREQHGPRIGDRAVSESREPEDARTFLRARRRRRRPDRGGTHPLAGPYLSKQAFLDAAFARLDGVLSGGVHLEVEHVFVDGGTAIVELYSTSTTNEGAPFANRYCWICRFDGDSVVTVRAYLDSTMVMYTGVRNETPAQNAGSRVVDTV